MLAFIELKYQQASSAAAMMDIVLGGAGSAPTIFSPSH